MTKRLLPTIVAVATLVSAAYMLTLVDEFVNSTLYSYGLVFSYDWANPYWTLFKVTWALLAICAAAITMNTIIIIRSSLRGKKQSVEVTQIRRMEKDIHPTSQTEERPRSISITPRPPLPQKTQPKPAPTIAPPLTPSPATPETPLFKCTHCNKGFTQPLRMLDFQVDPPRIVNVCPFCSKTMSSGPSAKESGQDEDRSFLKKKDASLRNPLTH